MPVSDAIRIVPLKLPDAAAVAPTSVSVTYRGGALLTSVQVFSAFWGAAWNTAPQASLMQTLNAFFDFIVSSALLDQLAEYSVPGKTIVHGSHVGTTIITTPAPTATVDDSAIQSMLSAQISSNASFVKPNANTLYFVLLPSGVSVTQGGSSSCQSFCGYHDTFGSNLYYAVLPYPDCSGCEGGLSVSDALTTTASHELSEAVTDPVPGQGWYDDANGEIGDICAWETKKLGTYTIQRVWSNKAGACV